MATRQQSIAGKTGIAPRDLRRIAGAASRVEKSRASGSRPIHDRGRWFAPPSAGMIRTCVVSATITARSGTTMGTGQVKLCITDPDAGTEEVSTAPEDVWTVRNSYLAPFTADSSKRRKIHWEGGVWKILLGEC
ncbi:MAG: hypothetical protein U0800_25995 [Isosphaeraceae bacterium]